MGRPAYVLASVAAVLLVATVALLQPRGKERNGLRVKRPRPGGKNQWLAESGLAGREEKRLSRQAGGSATSAPLFPRKSKVKETKVIVLPNLALSADVVKGVQTFVFFIGYARSSHTLVASLLDAHPHMVVSNEYNLLRNYELRPAMRRHEMFENMYRRSRLDVEQGKRYDPSAPPVPQELQVLPRDSYSYYVPGQWQGKFRDYIQVIGDKKGGSTSSYLSQQRYYPILRRMVKKIGLRTRVIHVIRNPYDAIATSALRSLGSRFKSDKASPVVLTEQKLQFRINTFFTAAKANARAHRDQSFPAPAILDIHSHEFSRRPRVTLLKICHFLEIECDEDYLRSCAAIVRRKPSITRNLIVWPQHQKEQVQKMMQDIPFLAGYSFKSK